MASIGEILSRERDRQGVTLATIAQQTRIKLHLLEALERDQYDLLPGRFFIRSFALQYAEKLGINTDELMVAIRRLGAEPPRLSSMTFEDPAEPRLGALFPERPALEPLPEGTASLLNAKKVAHSVAMLVSVVVVCGLVFWMWQRQLSTTSAETNKSEAGPSIPELVPPPAVQPSTETKPPAESVAESAPVLPKQAAPESEKPAITPEKTVRTARPKRGAGAAARGKRRAKPQQQAQAAGPELNTVASRTPHSVSEPD